jgi:PHD/YefM family antitoxin component YafN of YafNO toxin-antitoxin module
MTKNLVVKEPVFIEEEGQPVAVILPIELYRTWQKELQAAGLAVGSGPTRPLSDFERQKAAFERLKPALMKQYPGQCVAIVGGEVVEVGDDKVEIVQKVRERFGGVPMYVQWVTEHPPVYHVPYRRAVGS